MGVGRNSLGPTWPTCTTFCLVFIAFRSCLRCPCPFCGSGPCGFHHFQCVQWVERAACPFFRTFCRLDCIEGGVGRSAASFHLLGLEFSGRGHGRSVAGRSVPGRSVLARSSPFQPLGHKPREPVARPGKGPLAKGPGDGPNCGFATGTKYRPCSAWLASNSLLQWRLHLLWDAFASGCSLVPINQCRRFLEGHGSGFESFLLAEGCLKCFSFKDP